MRTGLVVFWPLIVGKRDWYYMAAGKEGASRSRSNFGGNAPGFGNPIPVPGSLTRFTRHNRRKLAPVDTPPITSLAGCIHLRYSRTPQAFIGDRFSRSTIQKLSPDLYPILTQFIIISFIRIVAETLISIQ